MAIFSDVFLPTPLTKENAATEAQKILRTVPNCFHTHSGNFNPILGRLETNVSCDFSKSVVFGFLLDKWTPWVSRTSVLYQGVNQVCGLLDFCCEARERTHDRFLIIIPLKIMAAIVIGIPTRIGVGILLMKSFIPDMSFIGVLDGSGE